MVRLRTMTVTVTLTVIIVHACTIKDHESDSRSYSKDLQSHTVDSGYYNGKLQGIMCLINNVRL